MNRRATRHQHRKPGQRQRHGQRGDEGGDAQLGDREAVEETDHGGSDERDDDRRPEAEIGQEAGHVHHDLPFGAGRAHHHRGEDRDGDDRKIDAGDQHDQGLAEHEDADHRALEGDHRKVRRRQEASPGGDAGEDDERDEDRDDGVSAQTGLASLPKVRGADACDHGALPWTTRRPLRRLRQIEAPTAATMTPARTMSW